MQVIRYIYLFLFYLDSLGNEAEGTLEGDSEVYLDEDENEEKWRKLRYEREVFLKKV